MTVAELLKKKRVLEETLSSYINEFEADCKIKISNIYCLRGFERQDSIGKSINKSKVHVTLDL